RPACSIPASWACRRRSGNRAGEVMKDTLARLQWRHVAIRAAVQAAIAIPALIVGSAVNGDVGSNTAVVALVLVLFVAPFVAGIIAAIDERSMPYVHGAVAAGLGWLAIVLHALGRLVFG